MFQDLFNEKKVNLIIDSLLAFSGLVIGLLVVVGIVAIGKVLFKYI